MNRSISLPVRQLQVLWVTVGGPPRTPAQPHSHAAAPPSLSTRHAAGARARLPFATKDSIRTRYFSFNYRKSLPMLALLAHQRAHPVATRRSRCLPIL